MIAGESQHLPLALSVVCCHPFWCRNCSSSARISLRHISIAISMYCHHSPPSTYHPPPLGPPPPPTTTQQSCDTPRQHHRIHKVVPEDPSTTRSRFPPPVPRGRQTSGSCLIQSWRGGGGVVGGSVPLLGKFTTPQSCWGPVTTAWRSMPIAAMTQGSSVPVLGGWVCE